MKSVSFNMKSLSERIEFFCGEDGIANMEVLVLDYATTKRFVHL